MFGSLRLLHLGLQTQVLGTLLSSGAMLGRRHFRRRLGGIALHSNASDYAEWLPRLTPTEQIQPGDIVGLYGGRITKRTQGASRVMVVSTGPIVLATILAKSAA